MKMSHGILTATVSLLSLVAGCMSESDPDDSVDPEVKGANVCKATALQVIVQGRENRFGLNGQQVALNPAIPIDRICNSVVNNTNCKTICASAKATVVASGITGFQDADPVRLHQMGVVADKFNKSFGIVSHFSDLGSEVLDPADCGAKQLQVVVRAKEHRFGFDGAQVALNPQIPMDNICQKLSGSCKAACSAAEATAVATGVKGFSGADNAAALKLMGQLADKFNADMGSTSNFTNNPIVLQ
jgi:hypothetical protein